MTCEQLLVLPQASRATQVSVRVRWQPLLTVTLLQLSCGVLQPSAAVTLYVAHVGTLVGLFPNVSVAAGQLTMAGALVSTVQVIFCVHVRLFPQESVAL